MFSYTVRFFQNMLPTKKVIKIIYLYIQTGPTQVGDGHSDPDLMKCIDAALVKDKLLGDS